MSNKPIQKKKRDIKTPIIIGLLIIAFGYSAYVTVEHDGLNFNNYEQNFKTSLVFDSCSTLKGYIQQNMDNHGILMDDMRQSYKDKKCGDPDKIPRMHSVIPNSTNISSLTRDDVDVSKLDSKHTVIINCVTYSINPDDFKTKQQQDDFYNLLNSNHCLSNYTSEVTGHWNYYK